MCKTTSNKKNQPFPAAPIPKKMASERDNRIKIRALLDAGQAVTEIARQLNVSRNTVYAVSNPRLSRERWGAGARPNWTWRSSRWWRRQTHCPLDLVPQEVQAQCQGLHQGHGEPLDAMGPDQLP